MADRITHDEIAQRFADSGAIDFNAAGKFFAEIGPVLAQQDDGLHGVLVGRYNLLACMLTARDLDKVIGLRDIARISDVLDVTRQQ
ncbi:hypothetical protein [Microbacterium sp. bgisy189]|uniref:hypothetical protein n=1 Tax=Microbacterium sp. bgisy189 TaxID=3413798 RepID=UPI003EBD1C0A